MRRKSIWDTNFQSYSRLQSQKIIIYGNFVHFWVMESPKMLTIAQKYFGDGFKQHSATSLILTYCYIDYE
jgi:hypothetical protein